MSYRTTRLNELELLNSSQKDTVDNRPLSSIFINLQYHRRLFLYTSSMIYAHFSFNSPFSPIPAQQSLRFSLMPDRNSNTTESKTPKGSSQINQKRSAKVKTLWRTGLYSSCSLLYYTNLQSVLLLPYLLPNSYTTVARTLFQLLLAKRFWPSPSTACLTMRIVL